MAAMCFLSATVPVVTFATVLECILLIGNASNLTPFKQIIKQIACFPLRAAFSSQLYSRFYSNSSQTRYRKNGHLVSNMAGNSTEDDVEFKLYIVAAQTTLAFVTMVGSLICNLLVAIVIAKKARHHSPSSSNLFLFNLAFANVLLSVLVLPFVIVSSLKQAWIFGDAWCQASGFFTILLCTDSILTAMILCFDRYHYIVNPLSYPMRMSPTKTRVLIVYTWLQSVFTAVLPLVGWGVYGYEVRKSSCTVKWNNPRSEGYTKLYAISAFILPLLVMIWAYYHILKAARRQARIGNIAVLNVGFRSSISSTGSGHFTGAKALRTAVIVLGTVLLCLGPYIVTILLESSNINVPHEVHSVATMLTFCISCLYPVIYGLRVKGIRREIRRFLYTLCCCVDYVRPLSAALFVSPAAAKAFRNRSVSDGSVCSIGEFDAAPKTDTDREVGWCLPSIREEIVIGRDAIDSYNKPGTSTELTDLEVMSLPGQILEKY